MPRLLAWYGSSCRLVEAVSVCQMEAWSCRLGSIWLELTTPATKDSRRMHVLTGAQNLYLNGK